MTPFEKTARAFIATRRTAGTRYLYSHDLTRWLAHCADADTLPTAEDVAGDGFRDMLLTMQKPVTVRRTLAALSRIYRAVIARGVAAFNPFDPDVLPRPPAATIGKTRAISEADAKRLIKHIERKQGRAVYARDAAIVHLLYATGLRVHSVVEIRYADIFVEGEGLLIRTKAKHKDLVEVEVPARAAEALKAWLQFAPRKGPIFPGRKGTVLTTKAVNKRLIFYCREAKIDPVHPHQFRAAFITAALDANIPLPDVQASAHHSDPKQTLRYDRRKRGTGVTSAVAKSREKGAP